MNPKQPNESDERFRQLGLFSIIVAELTLVPGALGYLAYRLTQPDAPLGVSWKVWTAIGTALGFGVGFYRIYLLTRAANKREGEGQDP